MPKTCEQTPAVEVAGRERPGETVIVFTIHDGNRVPASLLGSRAQDLFSRPEVRQAHLRERDWGANLVAGRLAEKLGLGGYLRVNLPRILLDYGRFPGTSEQGAPYLLRKSIYPPMEGLLSEEQKNQLLDLHYQEISNFFAQRFAGKRLNIAIHTCDRTNANGTLRPELSLVTRSLEYQRTSDIPKGIFDPLFPASLTETTCHRMLVYGTLMELERSGYHTALNYPYLMPAGSVEIRAQVRFFFSYLKREFTKAFPESAGSEPFARVWEMVHDVTCAIPRAQSLEQFIHRGLASRKEGELFAEAREAYGEIQRFLGHGDNALLERYRRWTERPSSLGIEVRKDLLHEIDAEKGAVHPKDDADAVAANIADVIAGAVGTHLRECYAEIPGAPASGSLDLSALPAIR